MEDDSSHSEHHDVPYYRTNIDDNMEKIVAVATKMLDDYGGLTETTVEGSHAVIRSVTWDIPDLAVSYGVSQLVPPYAEQYGNHVMVSVVNYYGEEYDERVHVFSRDAPTERINRVVHILALTAAHQKEHEEWFAAHSRPAGDGEFCFAVRPDTTDDIAYDIEMLLDALLQGSEILTGK